MECVQARECACVFNSLRKSIWVFLCCQIWWFGGNFQPWIQSIPAQCSEPAAPGMKRLAFIFNDINLSTGTISGCWLRFDSMFPCFYLGDTCTRFLIAAPFPYSSLFSSHMHADNNQQLPDGALLLSPRLWREGGEAKHTQQKRAKTGALHDKNICFHI